MTPRVVAHRGSSALLAEHTLSAYEQAVADGADALECDVRLTADGHLVCVHDRTLSRTSDARGVVSASSLRELRDADFGRAPTELPDRADDLVLDSQATPLARPRVPVLQLSDLLGLVADSGRRMELLVETKHPTRYGGLVEQRLIECLERYGMTGPRRHRVTVMSFATSALRRVRSLAPQLRTVQLMARVPLMYRQGALPYEADVAGPSIQILRAHPGYVRRVHDNGHPVFVWTVDEPADVELAVDLGVDSIITNRPGPVLAQLGRKPVLAGARSV